MKTDYIVWVGFADMAHCKSLKQAQNEAETWVSSGYDEIILEKRISEYIQVPTETENEIKECVNECQ